MCGVEWSGYRSSLVLSLVPIHEACCRMHLHVYVEVWCRMHSALVVCGGACLQLPPHAVSDCIHLLTHTSPHLLYCFTVDLLGTSRTSHTHPTSALLLYGCFTAALLFYCCSTAGQLETSLTSHYYCFSTALLLLYCCFTAALLVSTSRLATPPAIGHTPHPPPPSPCPPPPSCSCSCSLSSSGRSW